MKRIKLTESAKETKEGFQDTPLRPSVPTISCGTRQQKLLIHLLELDGERLNVSKYSKAENVDASSVRQSLKRSLRSGFVTRPYTGMYILTDKGVELAESFHRKKRFAKGDVGGKSYTENLSTHHAKFFVKFKDKFSISKNILFELGAQDVKEVKLPNYVQKIAKFDDATLIINLNNIVVRIGDVISDSAKDGQARLVAIGLKYVDLLDSKGFRPSELKLDAVHYARVGSVLAESFEKVAGKFKVELSSGRSFWIDHSTGVPEDETDDADVRERLDEFVKDLVGSDSNLSDVDKLIQVTANLVRLELLKRSGLKGDVDE